jgi:hypothetical protein
MIGKGDYRFDLDLKKGLHFENELYKILTVENGTQIEVKADRWVSDTKRLAIEFKCRGKLSGISTSEAIWYAFVLGGDLYKDEVIVLIKTERLKKLVKKIYKKYKKIIHGGDDNLSQMILIDVYDLLTANII